MKIIFYASTLLLLGLVGCNFRSLKEEQGPVANIAKVPVTIDWSQSGLESTSISRATVRVFPHDGSPAYDFVMQESLTQDVMPLAVGKYSLVVFNETTDANDWKALAFKGADKYETFAVTTTDDTFRGLYTKAGGEVIRKSPDRLAVWSLDEFEVTAAMAAASKSEQQITAVPATVVKQLSVVARVVNLVSAKKSSGTVRGAAGGVLLATRKPIEAPVTHIFVMNGRQYDDPAIPKDGTLGAVFTIFDLSSLENLKCELLLDFMLYNETSVPTEVFDITGDVKTDKAVIEISVGGGERKIVLPMFPIGGENVGVDEWDDIIIPMP